MADLLYLVHRLPYPPTKGDKVRSYHLLRYLAARHRVFLGTFVDDPEDLAHVEALKAWCAEVCALPIEPRARKLASLAGLLTGEALTLRYYRDARLVRWVQQLAARQALAGSVVFSSSMAPYAEALLPHTPMLLDLVDVDSAKWTAYAEAHSGPLAWLYGREGRRLLDYEREAVLRARRAWLVTDNEVALFNRLAPAAAGRVEASCNGVDADHFAPQPDRPSPFGAQERALVFTGAMDYWPNVDAVAWFTEQMLPALLGRWPDLRFYIVGRSPTPAVRALAGERVVVTGTVDDVRPYLQHAAAVVAPLRLARGVQNKVLEAMAMARPVVTARTCAEAIEVQVGDELLVADEPSAYIERLDRLLAQPAEADAMGRRARARVLAAYSWTARLAGIGAAIDTLPAASARAGASNPRLEVA